MKAKRIKITGCGLSTYWYNGKVGQTYTVRESIRHPHYYRVVKWCEDYRRWEDGIKFVEKGDCIIVTKFLDFKIKPHVL